MSQRIKIYLLGSLACFVAAVTTSAQKQLQDTFILEKTWTNSFYLGDSWYGYGITVDYSNRCYVANGNAIVVYNSLGNAITNWSVTAARYVCFDTISNVVFVGSMTSSSQIQVYDSSLHLISQWGTNSLINLSGLSVGTDGQVYATIDGFGIQVFDRQGNPLRQITGQFAGTRSGAIAPGNTIYVGDTANHRIQQFDTFGNLLQRYTIPNNLNVVTVAISPDGLIYVSGEGGWQAGYMLLPTLSQLFTLNLCQYQHGAAFSPDGQRFYMLGDSQVFVFRRVYRTAGLKPPDALPLPVVLNTAQRSGTQWIDVDFSVVDSDNATVQVGAIGFVDGRQDLLAAVPMKTFTNGTDIVSWTNVTTGVQHHLTWDALTDWFALYGNIKINILAKDNRNLLDFHLITIPSNATYASPLAISVSPYGHTDFLGVWTWLIATRDRSVNLATGSVYAVGNLYGVTNNTLLAYTQIASGQTNTLTTTDGRTFLFAMISSNMVSTAYSNMIVREATTNEIYRAAMGTTHTNLTTITKWTPLVQINGLPVSVNEYGFDTGSITAGGGLPNNAWWVVLAPPGQ